MSAAEALSIARYESRLPKASPEKKDREEILRELNRRIIEISYLEDGWDGRGSKKPTQPLMERAAELGLMIAGCTFPVPKTLNMGASADGYVQFALFGPDGREADLWVESDGLEFAYVACHGDDEYEGKMQISNFMRFAAWLAGDSKTP